MPNIVLILKYFIGQSPKNVIQILNLVLFGEFDPLVFWEQALPDAFDEKRYLFHKFLAKGVHCLLELSRSLQLDELFTIFVLYQEVKAVAVVQDQCQHNTTYYRLF